jgi:N-acetyl-anhydromuramyl-L-alanine amidase AmpD
MTPYTIVSDRLHIGGTAVSFRQARDVGGRITPTLVVLHDTAGGLEAAGSISWLAGNPGKTSAHFVVGRDGVITQLADADRKCNHAGKSSWRGRQMCNGFSIGIEIVNPGKLLERGDGAVSSVGTVYDRAAYGIGRCTTPAHGDGWWMPYTPQQIEAVEQLVSALAAAYPTITEVVGHHDISPGRKVDPTPLMDWPRMRAALARAGKVAPHSPAEADIEAAQARLDALGYNPGLIDGRLGTRTSAALFAFQRENGLPPTGKPDAATLERLRSDSAKPMPTGHREEATVSSLAAAGSQTAHAAVADRREGLWQASIATATGVMVAARQFIEAAGAEIAILALCGIAAYFGWRQLNRGTWLGRHRLAEHKAGVK